jgi:hypothetical protein
MSTPAAYFDEKSGQIVATTSADVIARLQAVAAQLHGELNAANAHTILTESQAAEVARLYGETIRLYHEARTIIVREILRADADGEHDAAGHLRNLLLAHDIGEYTAFYGERGDGR